MRKLYIIFLISILVTGCDNNLEINPTNTLTPETLLEDPDNLDRLLIGAYAFSDNHHAGEFQTVSELLVNEGNLAYRGTFAELFQIERKEVIATNFFIRFLWGNSYRSINLCNIVLDNLDLIEDSDQRARLEGEAKFMRGLLYFEMVRYFALPYESGSNNSQLGLPVVFDAVTDVSQLTYPSRNTVEEVYSQILSDLQEAYNLLPPDNGFRADAYAAQAVLARVYLQQGNYSAARDAANDVLQNSGHALAPDLASALTMKLTGLRTYLPGRSLPRMAPMILIPIGLPFNLAAAPRLPM